MREWHLAHAHKCVHIQVICKPIWQYIHLFYVGTAWISTCDCSFYMSTKHPGIKNAQITGKTWFLDVSLEEITFDSVARWKGLDHKDWKPVLQ